MYICTNSINCKLYYEYADTLKQQKQKIKARTLK